MRYSFDEFRRILVEENTFIDNKEPIIPRQEIIDF
jgi:hypothetical protein